MLQRRWKDSQILLPSMGLQLLRALSFPSGSPKCVFKAVNKGQPLQGWGLCFGCACSSCQGTGTGLGSTPKTPAGRSPVLLPGRQSSPSKVTNSTFSYLKLSKNQCLFVQLLLLNTSLPEFCSFIGLDYKQTNKTSLSP